MFELRPRSGVGATPERSDGTPHAASGVATATVGAVDPSMRTMARGTRNNAIGTVVDRMAGFGLMLVLALLLSPRSLGSFYKISAVFALLTAIGLMGLDVGVIKTPAAAIDGARRGKIQHSVAALVVSTTGSAAVAVCLWFAAPWLAGSSANRPW